MYTCLHECALNNSKGILIRLTHALTMIDTFMAINIEPKICTKVHFRINLELPRS